jgi:hypothetical protein
MAEQLLKDPTIQLTDDFLATVLDKSFVAWKTSLTRLQKNHFAKKKVP